jgi:hypothetical protein
VFKIEKEPIWLKLDKMMTLLAKEHLWAGKRMICRVKELIWGEMKANKNKDCISEKTMICKVMEVI